MKHTQACTRKATNTCTRMYAHTQGEHTYVCMCMLKNEAQYSSLGVHAIVTIETQWGHEHCNASASSLQNQYSECRLRRVVLIDRCVN